MQITQETFNTLMSELPVLDNRVAVAVSGGADSLSLCLLADEWARASGREIVALSIDHALRAQSAGECQFVKGTLNAYGIEHHTLVWEGEKPLSGIQAAARQARYQLLQDWCDGEGIRDLLVGHHQNDQAETFMMRLVRGSSVDGLSAMKSVSTYGKLRVLRPLLTVPKDALVTFLEDRKLSWVEDPSNKDESFDRVKMRNAMEVLSAIGLTPERLSQTALSMQRVRTCLEGITEKWLTRNTKLFQEGYVLLNFSALENEDEEVVLRGLRRIGMDISGDTYPPRLDSLQRLLRKLRLKEDGTLMGCRWIVQQETVLICREVRETEFPTNVYHIDFKDKSSDLYMRVLGEDGWKQLLSLMPEMRHANLPKPVIYALVSFWDEEGVSVVPHLGYKRDNVRFDADIQFIARNGLFS
jgi:tRNA(Ile)-lysidine synthase